MARERRPHELRSRREAALDSAIGYLVDHAGRPVDEVLPGRQVFLRLSARPGKHPWQFATGKDVVAVVDRPWGVQAILEGGERLEVRDVEGGLV